MKYRITLEGHTYEIEVVEEQAMLLKEYEAIAPAPVTAAPVTAAPVTAAAAPAPAPAPAPASAPAAVVTGAGEPLNTPMPGTILQVNTAVGQSVKKGDVLIVLEAMKMENEITSPKDGTVTQVAVQPNVTVNTGDLLVVID